MNLMMKRVTQTTKVERKIKKIQGDCPNCVKIL